MLHSKLVICQDSGTQIMGKNTLSKSYYSVLQSGTSRERIVG